MGINHLMNNEDDDYEEVINKGDDPKIYGRYQDIENLGHDIEIEQSTVFRNSSYASKDGKSTIKL